jgi:hypothetical protein
MKLSHALLITVVSFGLGTGSAWAGAGGMPQASSYSQRNASLVIKRSPNFGNETHFNIYIDGTWVDNLSYGETYRGLVPAGQHLIRIKQMPHLNDAYPYSEQLIWLEPGRTSVFTATWTNAGTWIALKKR